MFNLLRKRRVHDSELLQSALYDESSFYQAFLKDVASAQRSIIIESPFLTEKRAREFSKLFKKLRKREVTIRVNTRNPRHHDKLLEIQAWKAMKVLREHGVKVYTYNDMRHRKLAIIDGCVLWDGSLNILSQAFSREIMRRTESTKLCAQMVAFTRLKSWHW